MISPIMKLVLEAPTNTLKKELEHKMVYLRADGFVESINILYSGSGHQGRHRLTLTPVITVGNVQSSSDEKSHSVTSSSE